MKQDNNITSSSLLGITSEDILQSIKLQEDIDLRNTLQQSIGPIKDFKLKSNDEEKTIEEIRRETRQSRINHYDPKKKAKVETPSLKESSSPPYAIDLTQSKRFSNNRLSTSQINLKHELAAEPSNVAAVPSKSPVDKRKNEVMMRLLSSDSPTSPHKRKAFRKLCGDDKEARTIVNLSIQMDATVEQTKDMLLNHCEE